MGYHLLPGRFGPAGLVRNFPVLMPFKRMIALALSAVLTMASLSACHAIVQPSCSDIARANFSMLEDPVRVQAELDIVSDTIVAYYQSDILCSKEKSYWNGLATVFYDEQYFYQECISQADPQMSGKMWRGSWAKSDTGNPVALMEDWLHKVNAGVCIYDRSPTTSTDADGSFYELTLSDANIDWDSICDADFDSLFGGEQLLYSLEKAEIVMRVDANTLLIKEILIECSENAWCQVKLTIGAADTEPVVVWSNEMLEEAFFSEEWNMSKPSH